jgi:hypothetical protein
MKYGRHRMMALVTTPENERIVVTIGFEFEPKLVELEFLEPSAGIQVAFIAEAAPQPTAHPSRIRDVVEFDDMTNPDYKGHQIAEIALLFPRISAWKTSNLADTESVWQIFLLISAQECQNGGSWIEADLAEELEALARLHVPSLPYRALCQSMFDLDPRSLFMALYRCIEATYAYESCRNLIVQLALDADWQDVAQALASTVSWRPPEASSLQLTLSYAIDEDLENLCRALGANSAQDLRVEAGRAIYDLRNRIVHYRPWLSRSNIDDLDWSQICVYLVRIVLSVFHQAFSNDSPELTPLKGPRALSQ